MPATEASEANGTAQRGGGTPSASGRAAPPPDTGDVPGPGLAYAPPPAWHRRRRARRVLLLVLLVAVLGCLATWRKPLVEHARLLYWQHACATYEFAPGTVVAASGGAPALTAVPVPACWASYEQSAIVAPPARPTVKLGSGFLWTLAFLHAQRSPAGHERIVAVRCVPLYLPSASVVQAFDSTVAERAAARPLSSRPVLHGGHFGGGYPMQVPVRVFGGQ